MFATKFGEPNFLLSGRVYDNSKILFNRDPRDRVEKVAPWLTVDSDPYPAVVDGRIEWIIDGYTTTDRYPNSQKESFETMTDDSLQDETGLRTLPTDEINYMRNAVKATVDAYTGEVTLYAWDEEDPILKAWRSAFPGTVKDKSEISAGPASQHLRYPEDLFQVQRYQFARYHVTDPGDFYQGNNRWEVPEDPYTQRQVPAAVPALRRQCGVRRRDRQRPGVLADVGLRAVQQEQPGVLRLGRRRRDQRRVRQDARARADQRADARPGPGRQPVRLRPAVADLLAQFNRSGAQPVYGNLLTLPINDGLMYVQPVYATRELSDSSFPILRYVLVKYGNDIGVGSTLRGALADLLGTSDVPAPDQGGNTGNPSEPGTGSIDSQIQAKLAGAETAFNDAQAALEANDLGEYQARSTKAQTARRRRDRSRRSARRWRERSARATSPRLVQRNPRGVRQPVVLTPIWPVRPHPVRLCSPARGGAAR